MNVIEVEGVRKSFLVPKVRRETIREHALDLFRPRPVERLQVLDGVSFALGEGESLGIMGRNGSGKSTLLKIVAGIYQADAGTLRLQSALTPILDLGVGWNPDLDAVDNIYLIATAMGLSLREIREMIPGILEFSGLSRFARLKVCHFSSGMAARLAYTVAFHAARGVLVLDELLAVGDAEFHRKCYDRFRALRAAGHPALIVSHDPEDIRRFCDRVLLLEGGRIVREGPPEEVGQAYLDLPAAQ